MRTGIENWLLNHWYSTQKPPWYLRLLEPVYLFAYQRAQKKQLSKKQISQRSQNKLAIPLIVVGNITAGGSGKTPLVIHLCQLAKRLGLKVGIASTGYGRQGRQTMLVHADSDTRVCGDEPVLLAQRTSVPVVVAVHRSEAIKTLLEMGLNLVISDDGLQHADLAADIDICVVDGQRGLGNGHLIPAGPLREPADRLLTVDHIVSNGQWKDKPSSLDVSEMRLLASIARSLDDTSTFSLGEFKEKHNGGNLHAFAAIGNPNRFFTMLQSMGFSIETHSFSDHHRFTQQDFDSLPPGATILMTEKDAVKCRALTLRNAWYIPVETQLSDEFERILQNQIIKLTEESSK